MYDVKNFLKMASMFLPEQQTGPVNNMGINPSPPSLGQTLAPTAPAPNASLEPAAPVANNNEFIGPPMPYDIQMQEAGNPYSLPPFIPETRAIDRATSMLDSFPTPTKPSLGRKIGASLVSLGVGPEQGARSMHGPYYRAVDDWKERFKPTLDLANQERYYNANMRSMHQAQMRDTVANRRADIAQGELDRKTKEGERRLANQETKLKLDDWKAKNPGGQVKIDENNEFIVIDKFGKVTKTGFSSNGMTEWDKLDLLQEHKMEQINRQGEIGNERMYPPIQIFTPSGQPGGVYQWGPGGGPPREVTPPGGGVIRTQPPGASSQSETYENADQQRKSWQNNAIRIMQQYPDLAKFIDYDPEFAPDAPPRIRDSADNPGWFTGSTAITPEEKAFLQEQIFGDRQVLRRSGSGPAGLPPMKPMSSRDKTALPKSTAPPTNPKKGDKHTAPNGVKLEFDGTGWVRVP